MNGTEYMAAMARSQDPAVIEFREALVKERKGAKAAASAFVGACASGNCEEMLRAVDSLEYALGGWRMAFGTPLARPFGERP